MKNFNELKSFGDALMSDLQNRDSTLLTQFVAKTNVEKGFTDELFCKKEAFYNELYDQYFKLLISIMQNEKDSIENLVNNAERITNESLKKLSENLSTTPEDGDITVVTVNSNSEAGIKILAEQQQLIQTQQTEFEKEMTAVLEAYKEQVSKLFKAATQELIAIHEVD